MSAISPGEKQDVTLGSKEFCHESFSPGVHLKISTLGNPLFCASCPHIKNNHMKILNLFTKLMKQSFSLNDHHNVHQICATVLNFQKHSKSTTFQGKKWREIGWIIRIFSMSLNFSLHGSSQDTTKSWQRMCQKHQAYQNFLVQYLLCTQKAHKWKIWGKMAN